MEVPLAGFFLKKLLRRGCDLNDLPSLDAELYRSLLFLRDYDGDVEDLSLTFTVTDSDFGTNREARPLTSQHEAIRLAPEDMHRRSSLVEFRAG